MSDFEGLRALSLVNRPLLRHMYSGIHKCIIYIKFRAILLSLNLRQEHHR
jgi:hypothetical protein